MNQPDHSQAQEEAEGEERDQEELTSESDIEKIRKEQESALKEETPEMQTGGVFFNALSGIGLTIASDRLERIEAFEVLNDPHYEHNLLKVKHTGKYRQIEQAHRRVGEEIEKQRKREQQIAQKGGKAKDYAEVGTGPFKRKISFADYDRKKQAFGFAKIVQKRIDASEIKIRLNNAISAYGLDPENAKKLRGGLAKWLKDNPGKTADDYIYSSQARQLYRDQCKKSGKTIKEKTSCRELAVKNKQARMDAVRENKDQIIRAQGEIKKNLDPQQALLTPEQVKQREQYILQGTTPSPTPSATSPQTIPPPQPTTSVVAQPPAVMPLSFSRIPVINRFLERIRAINAAIERIRNQIRESINRAIQQITQRIREMARRFMERVVKRMIQATLRLVKKIVMKIATKILSKATIAAATALLGQIIGSALPGIGNAVMGAITTLASALGIDELLANLTINAAKFAVATVVACTIIFILIIPTIIGGLIPQKPSEAQSYQLPNNAKNLYSWQQFEKENLLLPLYSYRHNDMEK